MKKPEPLFYIPVPDNDHDVAGPYDLVQMAGLLRSKVVTAETLTYREGEQDWKPFGERPQYIIAVEIPVGADSMHLETLKLKEEATRPPIPLPSTGMMVGAGVAMVLLLIGGLVVYWVAAADTTTGFFMATGGGATALVAQAFILVKLMDESWLTRMMVLFVPLFDIYYFTANLEKYLPLFCAKYIGTIMALAAYAGIASVDSGMAEQMKALLGMFRL